MKWGRSTKTISQDHLLGIETLDKEDILTILDRADYYANNLDERAFRPDVLRGAVILTLFFEDSTRTRTSFEMGAKRLGADVVNIDIEHSSVRKGESLLDTVLTLHAMLRPDAVIIRHNDYGAPEFISQHVDCPVINAGDASREHPTQALLDALTIRRRLGKIEGLNIAICGDISHSRVANSNMILLERLGANVHIVAPENLMPDNPPAANVKKFNTLEEGIRDCDIVMMLRLQKERMEKGFIASEDEYFEKYGLTKERLACARPEALVMHPGPMIRGVEIAGNVADDAERSLILQQVRNGVPTRMAVLDLLLNR